LSPSFSWMVKI